MDENENKAVDREVVSIGLDFRPIPLDVGDGRVWEFTSDPDKEQWKALTDTMKGLAKFANVKEEDVADIDMSDPTDQLTNAVATMLVTPEQQKAWKKRGYGLVAQQRVAKALLEQWTGFPTPSPSPSGRRSKTTG